MTQPPQRLARRRTNVEELGSFTFSYRRPHSVGQVSAWMLDRSAEQAAFLTSARDAPEVGEHLELAATEPIGLETADRPLLPRFGQVVRLDAQGTTRRVAIRFEPSPR